MGIITDRELLSKIEGALDEIRPYLEADEGDIKLIEVTDDMVVKVKLMGRSEEHTSELQSQAYLVCRLLLEKKKKTQKKQQQKKNKKKKTNKQDKLT